MSNLHSNKTPN